MMQTTRDYNVTRLEEKVNQKNHSNRRTYNTFCAILLTSEEERRNNPKLNRLYISARNFLVRKQVYSLLKALAAQSRIKQLKQSSIKKRKPSEKKQK